MSVIIRLQNLPWSANALDIRNYFHGLSIPEGGVHIVGGELGDAFIAFSTDEDARQAMLNTGGKIKEVQVNLLLSSRSEMHKVIEAARQTVPFMQLSQPALPQPTVLSQSLSSMLIQNMKQNPLAVASLTNITQKIESPTHITQEEPIILLDAKEKDVKRRDSKGDRKSGRSRSKSRERDNKKDRSSRDKKDKRDRSRSRDRSRERRRRDRSNSHDRNRSRRDRKDRSRSRERDRTRESDPRRSRDKKPEEKKPEREPVKSDSVVQSTPPQPLFNQNNTNNNNNRWSQPFNNNNGNNTNFNVPPPGMPVQTFPNTNNAANVGPFNSLNRQRNNTWDGPKQGSGSPFENRNFNPVNNRFKQTESNDRNVNSFQPHGPPDKITKPKFDDFKPNFSNRTFDKQPRFENQFQNRRFQGESVPIDLCVKLVNIPYHISYSDIRNFFTGAAIASSGIKMINDSNGRKTGTIYIKFCTPDDKDFAIQKSGQFFKGANIYVSHVDDDEYNRAVDNYQPPETHEENIDSPDEDGSQQNLVICEKIEPIIERIYTVLRLEELPQSTKEHDIIRIFSNYSLLSIMIIPSNEFPKQQTAYVQFVKVEDARVAFNNRANHYIRHKLIKTNPCYPEEYEKIKSASVESSTHTPLALEESPIIIEEPEITQPPLVIQKPLIPESRDPRQKRFEIPKEDPVPFQNPLLQFPNMPPMPNPMIPNMPNMPNMPNQRFPWRPPLLDQNFNPDLGLNMPMGLPFHNQMLPNNNNMDNRNDGFNNLQMPLDCVLLKDLPLRTTDRDILDFFSDVGIIPARIHIMLNTQGQPSGDCFCEFNLQEEADKAASKNGSSLGMNEISIELVTRAFVEEALGQPPTEAAPQAGMLRGNLRGGRGGIIPRGAPRGHMNNNSRGVNMTEDFDSRGGNFRGNFRGGRGNFTPRGRGAPRGNIRGNYRGGRGGGFNNSFRQPQHESTNIDDPESFGKPGCVLAIENLHFRVATEDILDFFRGYGLGHDDIIRRFDERGMPTGDARVSFRSSHDASQALQKMNKRNIYGRTVSLRLL